MHFGVGNRSETTCDHALAALQRVKCGWLSASQWLCNASLGTYRWLMIMIEPSNTSTLKSIAMSRNESPFSAMILNRNVRVM